MLILRYGGDRLRESFQSYCERMELRALLEQWDTGRNLPLTPDNTSYGSKRKVWWRCEKGHNWQAAVHTRTGSGTGCPVCANREIHPAENDLASQHPMLAVQWHPTKNGSLTPEQIPPGTTRKVWWRCEKGHEWQASVASRVSGCGCPVCAGKVIVPGENDLQSLFPDIAKEWHPTRNGTTTPGTVSPYSNRKVWWNCEKGHDYQAVVAARTQSGCGCPYCAGRKVLCGFNDLATVNPDIAAQWYTPLNGNLTPQMVTAGSRKKVWWQCSEGHVWKAAVYSRTGKRKSGCPVCAGKVKVTQRYRDETTTFKSLANGSTSCV